MLTDKIKNGEDISADDGNITIVNTISLVEKEEIKKDEEITPDVKVPQAEEIAVQTPEESTGPSAPIIPTVDAESTTITPQVEVPTPEVAAPVVPSVEMPSVDVNSGVDTNAGAPIDSVLQGLNFNDNTNPVGNYNNVPNNIDLNTFSQSNVPTFDNNLFNSNQNMNSNYGYEMNNQNMNPSYDYSMNNQNSLRTMPSSSFNNPLEEMNNFVNNLTEAFAESITVLKDTLDNGVTTDSFVRANKVFDKASEFGIQVPSNTNTRRF